MGERKIDNLENGSLPASTVKEGEPVAASTESAAAKPAPVLVEVNYPEPTPLSFVLKDVARWSGLAFVMEPSINVKVQIFAPRRHEPEQAYELFLISLTVVGLRAIQIGKVVKIVPVQHSVSA